MECKECEKRGCPTEGMTGSCEFCGDVYCFGHLDINSHDCKIRTMIPGKLEKAEELLNEELKNVCKLLLTEVEEVLKDSGGCDHSVGVCWCDTTSLVDRSSSVLHKIELLQGQLSRE